MINSKLKLSPVARLAIGLSFLTCSLFLLGNFIGLIPNVRQSGMEHRKQIAELIAVQVSASISQDQLDDAAEILRVLFERGNGIKSIGLRAISGQLLLEMGPHLAEWRVLENGRSNLTQMQIPIHNSKGRWGALEIEFVKTGGSIGSLIREGSIAIIVLVIGLAGFLIYWIYLKRALSEIDPAKVVPQRVTSALNVLSEGLVMLDRSARIVLVNSSFEKKIARKSDNLLGVRLADLPWRKTDGKDADLQFSSPWSAVLEGEVKPAAMLMTLDEDGATSIKFTVNAAPISAPDGSVKGVVVTFDDVTELQQQKVSLEQAVDQLKDSQREITRKNGELQILATRDPLTSTMNRRSLFEGMGALMQESRGNDRTLSCIMVDIDHFKSVNDNYGHSIGDTVIKQLAQILTSSVGPDDLVGRYGGEEFVVVLPGLDELAAAQMAERMRTTIFSSEHFKGVIDSQISGSFGVAAMDTPELTPDSLVDRADQALYLAKEGGRNKVVRYSVGNRSDESFESTPAVPGTLTQTVTQTATKQIADKSENPLATFASIIAGGGNNRAGMQVVLIDRIVQGIERCNRFDSCLAVLAVQFDDQDWLGISAEDGFHESVMESVNSRLLSTIRSTDSLLNAHDFEVNVSISRTDKAEFSIVLADLSEVGNAVWIVNRITSELKESVSINGLNFSLNAYVGVSLYPGDGDEASQLLTNANRAMIEVKLRKERTRCLYFNEEMNREFQRKLSLESELRAAVQNEELYLLYQPQINLDDGLVAGFETLVRWKNPKYGLISPDIFIPIAEKSGLIDPIGRWIFESAVYQIKSWAEHGHGQLTTSINFSAEQFRDEELGNYILETVAEAGIPPASVVLEITETALLDDIQAAATALTGLQEAGFRIALDDFGTGYSTLSYIKNLPLDIVKIDQSFFSEFPNNQQDTALVSAILSMSRKLGCKVVAEGVETLEQVEALMKMQCDFIQGYVFSVPLNNHQALDLLESPGENRKLVTSLARKLKKSANEPAIAIDGVFNEVEYRRRA